MLVLNMAVGTSDVFEEISLTDECDDNDESIDSPEVFTYEIPSRPKLFKMPKKQALVWKYFGFPSPTADKNKPVCSICYDDVPCKNSNISNLYPAGKS